MHICVWIFTRLLSKNLLSNIYHCAFVIVGWYYFPCLLFCRRAYDLDITDLEQPLLIHRPKKKQRGKEETSKVSVAMSHGWVWL